jgi:hypothetical protein
MTNDAIIGHSGFVGGALVHQHAFDGKFNSSNIDTIARSNFDTVVCAAAPGSMFIANRYPDRDRAAIDALIDHLSEVQAQRFVLISSIAVLADFAAGVDERTRDFQQDLAYGHHRRLLEAFCESHFDNCLVVRLPALFGLGLKKNFLFDLMNPVPSMIPEERLKVLLDLLEPVLRATLADFYALDTDTGMFHLDRNMLNVDTQRPALDAAVRAMGMSATQFHHPDSTYQYYDMARLWQDIEAAITAGLSCVHLTVAPLRAADIHARLLGTDMPVAGARLHCEDMRTCHAEQWRCEGPYLEDAVTVMNKLATFFNDQRCAL